MAVKCERENEDIGMSSSIEKSIQKKDSKLERDQGCTI